MGNQSATKLFARRYAGWIAISLICGVAVVRWLTLQSFERRFGGSYEALSSIGKLTGLLGFLLYALNFVLSTRIKPLEDLFGGLNRVYIAHHVTGGLALILLSFHPLLLAVRYIEISNLSTLRDAALALLPQWIPFSDGFAGAQESIAINAGIVAFLGMVVLLLLTFFIKLRYQLWLLTHKILGVAFFFAAIHVLWISSDIAADSILQLYAYFWGVLGLVAFVYRLYTGTILRRTANYVVQKIEAYPGDVVHLSLQPTGRSIDYKPGQFVFIRFNSSSADKDLTEAHPFSIASAPYEGGLRIYAKALGDFTQKLVNLRAGDTAVVEGAFGRFAPVSTMTRPQIWIAGGIGITPFLSMARSITASSPNTHLIYSVTKQEELLEQNVLRDWLPSNFANFRYDQYVYEDQKTFLDAAYIERLCGQLDGKEIFICGPPAMMSSIKAQLLRLGVSKYNIHTEEFSIA